ncbi:MAG: orotidine-5'-phosphate decarboxylase [Candidatus Omnitrophica bacterium]|nr:orotidine-5'-phosphate decarboxylase [Candidatus Omnitrophota bacterium]
MKLKDRIIVALDVNDAESCKALLDKLYPTIKAFKVGSQLFTAVGQEAINMIKRKGASCFLDLKFHDIPATVGKTSASATSLGADLFDMHASGGFDMMKEAVRSSEETAERLKIKKPLILGVTVLTSMDKKDLEDLGIKRDTKDEVLFLAELAKKAGLDGVIASADETESIKKNLGKGFVVVTPGIRPSWTKKADQKRIATPKEAFDRGADYIVIGRAITEVEDPKAAAERIIGEIEGEPR